MTNEERSGCPHCKGTRAKGFIMCPNCYATWSICERRVRDIIVTGLRGVKWGHLDDIVEALTKAGDKEAAANGWKLHDFRVSERAADDPIGAGVTWQFQLVRPTADVG